MRSKSLQIVSTALVLSAFAGIAAAERLVATTLTGKVVFESENPGEFFSSTTYQLNQQGIIGGDIRPSDGKLYLFVANLLGPGAGLYVGDPEGDEFGLVATPSVNIAGASSIAFNPVTGFLRIVTSDGHNYRMDPDDGSVTTDQDLGYAVDDPNLGADARGITGLAYTNRVAGATSTQLYAIDGPNKRLVKLPTPNSGQAQSIGNLHRVATGSSPFTISPYTGLGYSLIREAGSTYLCRVNLKTGDTSVLYDYGASSADFRGLSVEAPAPVETIVGSDGNTLYTFRTDNPATILSTAAITGLTGAESILAMDYRPFNSRLYVLTSTGRICITDATNGSLTQVGSAITQPLTGPGFGFNFNPVVDRIRLSSGSGQNYRIDPGSGAVTVDTPFTYGGGSSAQITALAYSNNFAGASSTTLYGIDSLQDALVTSAAPNSGALTTIGALGGDVSQFTALDISRSTGRAYAVYSFPGGLNSYIAQVSLATGALGAPLPAATTAGVLTAATVAMGQSSDRVVALSNLNGTQWEQFQIEPYFAAPVFSETGGLSLSVSSTTAVTFGAWQTASLSPTEEGNWRIRFRIAENRIGTARLPELRIRAFRADNTENSMGGAADLGPLPGSSGYPDYVEVPWHSDGVSQWRVAIDVIGADLAMRGGFTVTGISMYPVD